MSALTSQHADEDEDVDEDEVTRKVLGYPSLSVTLRSNKRRHDLSEFQK